MTPCQNCGKLNSGDTNFCRFCGTKFVHQQRPQEHQSQPPTPSRPYAWKTDEFQTQTEPRQTAHIDRVQPLTEPLYQSNQNYHPAPLPYQQHVAGPFRCPRCMSTLPPRIEKRISTGGWITFAVLLVVFFPLFWIGLLMKEDVLVCQTCNLKIETGQR